MPLVSMIGGVIEKVKEEGLDPAKSYFYMPTLCMACNFPQFSILAGLAFESAGISGLKVGLINTMSPGEVLPVTLAADLIGDHEEPDFSECVRLMEEYKITGNCGWVSFVETKSGFC